MNQEEIYKELQAQWVKLNDLKVGDKVKITCKAEDHQGGWGNCWARSMTHYVGNTRAVISIRPTLGVELSGCGRYPFFVLEKVEIPKIVKSLTDILSIEAKDGVDIYPEDCGGWSLSGCNRDFNSNMAKFCGKSPDPSYTWLPEWLEESK